MPLPKSKVQSKRFKAISTSFSNKVSRISTSAFFSVMKFAERDESNLTELLQEFTSCKLVSTEIDPDIWFLKIDSINTKLKSINKGYDKKYYEMREHLLGNVAASYEDVKKKISGKESKHTVREIERDIEEMEARLCQEPNRSWRQ